MPESERPEHEQEISEALDRLTMLIDHVISEYTSIRDQSGELRLEYESLRDAVSGSGGVSAGDIEERLGRLSAENKQLRETMVEARGRAERIRSRLELVEDEV